MNHTILVTGAAGFLGSAICIDLAADNLVIGLDKRMPSAALRRTAPDVLWEIADIADQAGVKAVFRRFASARRPIDFVIHLAVYYNFGSNWCLEYEKTNITGTLNVIEAACCSGVKRSIFASSIAALQPDPHGRPLTEKDKTSDVLPYTKSKGIGEMMFAEYSDLMPAVILRLGGVFSDWCELPPLYSLMKLWSRPGFMGCLLPGLGETGFPYIHRKELVRIVRRVIVKNETLGRFETLFAAESGCTRHKELFPLIRRAGGHEPPGSPVHVPPNLVLVFLYAKILLNFLRKRATYERPWMVAYTDRPLVVDTSYTVEKLQCVPRPEFSILERLPILMSHFKNRREEWNLRNLRRNEASYEFKPEI